MNTRCVSIAFYGHIDDPPPAIIRWAVKMDILNPPWENLPNGVPTTFIWERHVDFYNPIKAGKPLTLESDVSDILRAIAGETKKDE